MKYTLCILFGFIFLAGCESFDNLSSSTPAVYNYGSTPKIRESDMPLYLNCSLITDVNPGYTWRGFQIGVTTYQELREELEPVRVYWDELHGHLEFDNQKPVLERDWLSFQACFVDNILSAMIQNTYYDIPSNLDGLILMFGEPDKVTWGDDYYTRSLIWSEVGLLVVVDVALEEISSFIIFPPIAGEDLEGSWLMQSLPQTGQDYIEPEDNIDSYQLSPKKEVEDPWDYND